MNTELLEWLRGKIANAENALKARQQAQQIWQSGTDEEWETASNLHPSTAGKPISKTQRLKNSEAEGRIAEKCRRDVEMFKAVYAAVEGITAPQPANPT